MSRPTIVCLCGSTRFHEAFAEANLRETLAGRIVLSVGSYDHSDSELGISQDSEVKRKLDELHLHKIDLADEVLILNVDGYVGESTARELLYALGAGKKVRFLEPCISFEVALTSPLIVCNFYGATIPNKGLEPTCGVRYYARACSKPPKHEGAHLADNGATWFGP